MVLFFVDLSTGALILFLGSPRARLDGHELPGLLRYWGRGWWFRVGLFALLRSAEGTDRRRCEELGHGGGARERGTVAGNLSALLKAELQGV
jgi:hypothetical protein